jgi:hypothetical protein
VKREVEDFTTIGVVAELPAGAWLNLSKCYDPDGDCDEACLCVRHGPGCFVKLRVGGLFVTPAPAILLESSVATIIQQYGVIPGQPDGDGPDAIDWHSMTEERVEHPPIRRVVFGRQDSVGKLCAADRFEGYQRTITAAEWDAIR